MSLEIDLSSPSPPGYGDQGSERSEASPASQLAGAGTFGAQARASERGSQLGGCRGQGYCGRLSPPGLAPCSLQHEPHALGVCSDRPHHCAERL